MRAKTEKEGKGLFSQPLFLLNNSYPTVYACRRSLVLIALF